MPPLAVSHADRMALVFRDQLLADPVLSAWSTGIKRTRYAQPRAVPGPWIDVSVSEQGVNKSDGTRCTEMAVVLSVGIMERLLSLDIEDNEGSFSAIVETVFAVAKAGEALQVPPAGDILSRGLERIEIVRLVPLEIGDRISIYRQIDIEHRVKVNSETWTPTVG